MIYIIDNGLRGREHQIHHVEGGEDFGAWWRDTFAPWQKAERVSVEKHLGFNIAGNGQFPYQWSLVSTCEKKDLAPEVATIRPGKFVADHLAHHEEFERGRWQWKPSRWHGTAFSSEP